MNNFGIGGVNVCVILEPNRKTERNETNKIVVNIPRIVNLCARTEQAFNALCDWFELNPQRISNDFLALLAPTMRITYSVNSSGMPYRGLLLPLNPVDKPHLKIERFFVCIASNFFYNPRPIYGISGFCIFVILILFI